MVIRLEDLEVYNLAESFGDEIWFLVIEWDYFLKDTVGKQMCRSADSIGANIAEGFGRYHFKETKLLLFQQGLYYRNKKLAQKIENAKINFRRSFLGIDGKVRTHSH
jgi:hypothetical protein